MRVAKKAPLRQLPLCTLCNDKSRHHEWTCPKRVKVTGPTLNNVEEKKEKIPEKIPEKNIPSSDVNIKNVDSNNNIIIKPSTPKSSDVRTEEKISPITTEIPSSPKKETPPLSPKKEELSSDKLPPSTSSPTNKSSLSPISTPTVLSISTPVKKESIPPLLVPVLSSTTSKIIPIDASPEAVANKHELHDVLRRKVTYDNIEAKESPLVIYYAKVLETVFSDIKIDGAQLNETRLKISNSFDGVLDMFENVEDVISRPLSSLYEPPSSRTLNTLSRKISFEKIPSPAKKQTIIRIADVDKVVVKEGFLTKSGKNGKDWKKRWCILVDGELVYYDSASSKKPNGSVDLRGSTIRPTKDVALVKPPIPFNFQIVDRSLRAWTFCVENDVEMISWFEAIAQVAGLPIDQLEARLSTLKGPKDKKTNVTSIKIDEKVDLSSSSSPKENLSGLKEKPKEHIIREELLLVGGRYTTSFKPSWCSMDKLTLVYSSNELPPVSSDEKTIVDLR